MELLGNLKIQKTTNTLLDMRNTTGTTTTSNQIDLTYAYSSNGISRSSFLITGRNATDSYKWRTGTISSSTWGNSGEYRIDELRSSSWESRINIKSDSGNVGIGTDTPDAKLHVVGSIKMVDGNQQNDYVLTSNASGVGSWQPWTGGIDKFITGGTYNASTEKIELTTNTGDVIYVPVSPLVDYDDQTLDLTSDTLTISKSNSTVDLSTYANQPNLWTESGANIYRSSNVGIGITNPTTQLTVNRTFSIENTDFNNSTSTGSRLLVGLNGTNGDTFSYMQAQDAGGTSNNNLILQRYGGNVGIGTTSPTTALSVVGSVSVTSNIYLDGQINMPYVNNTSPLDTQSLLQTTTRKAVIAMDMDGDDSYLEYGHVDAGQTYTQFRLRDNTTGDRFRIYVDNYTSPPGDDRIPLDVRGDKVLLSQDGGNVGIGTDSPTHRLHVEGSVKIVDGTQGLDKVLTSDANGLASWQTISVGDTNTDSQTLTLLGTNLNISGGNTIDVSSLIDDTNLWTESGANIYRSSNVGIGTTNPGAKLTLYGTNLEGWDSGIKLTREGGGEGRIVVDGDGMKFKTSVAGNGYYFRNYNNTTNLFIADGGNVGIGTSSPDTNLHVEGGIKINDGTALTNYVLTATDNNGMAEWKYNPTPIVIYATTELELIQGFQWFDNQNVAGIIKLGNDIQLSSDLTLDFQDGIELWGGDNEINSSLSGYKVIFEGTKGVCRNVVFQGNIDLAQPTTESQPIIDINGPYLKRLTLVDCTFSGVVGHSDYTNPTKYVINIEDTATDFLFFMSGIRLSYGTTASGYAAIKDVDSFRIALNCRLNGLSLMCSDWVVSYGEKEDLSTKWEHTKQGTLIRFDSTINKGNGGTDPNPQFKRKFAYDQSVTWDPSSRSKDRDYAPASRKQQWLDPYPTFWGPTTTQGTISPQSGNEIFGNPGDIYHKTDTGDLYMKHTSIGTNPEWIQIGGDTNTDNQQLALNTNTLSLTNSTPDIDLSKYEQTLSFNNPNLTLSDGGGTVNLSSLNTNTNYYLNSANIVGNTLTLGVNGTSNVSVNLNWTQNGNNLYNANSGNVGVNTSTPTSHLHVDGSVAKAIQWGGVQNYTITDDDYTIIAQTTYNVTLPNPDNNRGRIIVVKMNGSGTVSVCVANPTGPNGQVIDTSYTFINLTGVGSAITLQAEGSQGKWHIISCCGTHEKKTHTPGVGVTYPVGGLPPAFPSTEN